MINNPQPAASEETLNQKLKLPGSSTEEKLSEFWSPNSSRPIVHTDLVFRCSDGSVAAHKNILRFCCPLVEKILVTKPNLT
jgi:hypothetical protein